MKTHLFIVIFSLVLVQQSIAQKRGQARLDSLLAELPGTKPDTHQAAVLIDLSFTYYSIDPEAGLRYGHQGLALAEKLDWTPGLIDAYRALSVNHAFGKSEFSEALAFSVKSLALAEETGDKADAAKSLNNMGVIYWYMSDFPNALDHYFKALKIHESIGDKVEMANSLANIGLIYNNLEDFPKALEYLQKGNELDEALGNKYGVASNKGNIGEIYKRMGDFPKALQYENEAMKLFEELGDKNGVARNISNIGSIYMEMGDHGKALDYYNRGLILCREIGYTQGIAANLGSKGFTYLNIVKDEKGTYLNDHFGGNKQGVLQMAKTYTDSALVITKEIDDISGLYKIYFRLSEIQELMGDKSGALESYKQFTTYKDSVFTLEKDNKLKEAAMQYAFDKKEAEAMAEQKQKDIRQGIIRNTIIAGLIGALVFLVVVYRQRNRISKEKAISDAEKQRSEELLLNILPGEVAEELKATGSAKAKAYTMVTVMLTDFKDFTTISEKVSAELLVAEIHYCFSAFDQIIQRYRIEKIKTIGDAYLCASGLPMTNYTHASDILQAAFEIRAFMEKRKMEKESRGEIPFEIRIGVHTGPVVAGIVGVKKYAYDIWGDTVNLAARMEQNSEAGMINISGNTYELIKDQFHCTYRGKIEAKNKGMIDMYFAEPRA